MENNYLNAKLKSNGIEVENCIIDTLCDYANLIVEENKKYNLTSLVDDESIAIKHFADSLNCIKLLPKEGLVADLGSGAGLPIVPIALCNKNLNCTAIESTQKKANFLSLVCQTCNISNLNIVSERIEDVARGNKRESFDVVTARAVAPLNTLLEYAMPLLKVGGVLLAYKGQNYEAEIEQSGLALKKFSAVIKKVSQYRLENCETRVIIVIEKTAPTKKEYPRGQNKPRLKPIGG